MDFMVKEFFTLAVNYFFIYFAWYCQDDLFKDGFDMPLGRETRDPFIILLGKPPGADPITQWLKSLSAFYRLLNSNQLQYCFFNPKKRLFLNN
jgi:hypothetical protein